MDDHGYDSDEEIMPMIATIVGATITAVAVWYHQRYLTKEPSLSHDYLRRRFLEGMYKESSQTCRDQLRLNQTAFYRLCHLLRCNQRLRDSRYVTVEEQVTIFLHIIAHNVKIRAIRGYFRRSTETVSRYFNKVLNAVISLHQDFLKPPDRLPPQEIINDERLKYFKDCMGALDGTYIPAMVPLIDQGRYRNRKQEISQNVLGACSMDMKFTYVLAGWEGSASDSRVLQSALRRQNPLVVPTGKYYLVDAGYANATGFLAPYRGVRYHLNEWVGRTPQNPKELFNHRHSSARNVIERTFGLLKKRWAILRTAPFFDIDTQAKIVIACCIIHNHIRNVNPDDYLQDFEEELQLEPTPQEHDEMITQIEVTEQWQKFRDDLAQKMFADFLLSRN